MPEDWTIPAIDVCWMRDSAGRTGLSPVGDAKILQAYLDYCGAAPAVDERTGERCILTVGSKNEWIVTPAVGTSRFEQSPTDVTDPEAARALLTENVWHSVGWTVNRALVEVELSESGEGFSRFGVWGFDSVMGDVTDAYWTFRIAGSTIHVSWEREGTSEIGFVLRKDLRVAARIDGKGLSFTETTLTVDHHLFPPGFERVQSWPREYWGTVKSKDAVR
jgi:hypothetical protein